MIEAYPLSWPVTQPRTHFKKVAPFKTSFAKARDEIVPEVKRFGGRYVVISTNIPLRRDGLPYAGGFGNIEDVGVAVYFTKDDQQYVFACDKWKHVHDNMHAINKTISALRGIERWGSGEMMQQAFTGFKALPERAEGESCWDILGIDQTKNIKAIHDAFLLQAKTKHPDKIGGSSESFGLLQEARRLAMQYANS